MCDSLFENIHPNFTEDMFHNYLVFPTILTIQTEHSHQTIPPPCTHNADVPKLVSRGHGVVVQQTGCCHPAGTCVISKDDELVLITPVTDPEQALLHISDDHTLADCMDTGHQIWNVLGRKKDSNEVHQLKLQPN